ncbi:MAG: GNAT family N-acetyltransferase [Selenomonadaceae bacterium]|nr:GNAT family N-acetyltransferase [Selenomonadaceae bacterium]
MKSIIEALRLKVEENPQAVAISDSRKILSRGEFLSLVEKISAALPENCRRAGIILTHSVEQVAAIFAVLSRGVAYVPAEPTFPKERIRFMMRDAEVDVVISQENFSAKKFAVKPAQVKPDDLAYILYTSGTTGKPKGVAVTNANVLHYVRAFQNEFHIGAGDIMLQYSVCSFDIFVEEIFCTLLNGAKLAIPSDDDKKNITALMDFVEKNHVTIISGFPYLMQEINELEKIPNSLRLLISGGDVLREAYVDNLVDRIKVYNTYGPSETTVCASYYDCSAGNALDDGTYPIGKAVLGAEILLLDKRGEQVPQGDVGEICIMGGGVASYLHGDKNFEQYRGRKIYRSGDLGFLLADGNIAFLRRKDTQIMIYGKRVEVGEVENVLIQSGLIHQCYILPAVDADNLSYMVAYVVKKNPATTITEIRNYLADYLADFMIPEFFVELENLPLTPNGKIDKQSLPPPPERKIRQKFSATIRRLTERDIELLLELRMEVLSHVFSRERQEMSAAEWDSLREKNREYYLAELNRGGHVALVAESDGKILGCGGVCIYDELPSPDNRSGRCAYLMNIYTRKPYRKHGVAKKICERLIKIAREHGAEKIYLETSEAAKALYHALNFVEMDGYLKLQTT